MSVLVTGGAGFIGSNFILNWFECTDEEVVNLDALTYSGNLMNLASLNHDSRHVFMHGSICDSDVVNKLIKRHKPRAIINFAAESHVDRSILSPEDFIHTNIVGTFNLLESVRSYFNELDEKEKMIFRFLHVSTDEVYGSLEKDEPGFNEKNRYKPNSPYSASKAASDHLVRSYFHTYNLPTLNANCCNNYGPLQFPEKLVPLCINNALTEKSLPVYGDGLQIRDWIYVKDFCSAIQSILKLGRIGESYNVGGWCEKTNLEVIYAICNVFDDIKPRVDNKAYQDLITFVEDRPGHDRRYAIDASKIKRELDWEPKESFESGIVKTVKWYLGNNDWVSNVTNGEYINWYKQQYL
jgi:dTDP-glucose 4,6-dehydratase